MATISFKPKSTTKRLLAILPDRTRTIVSRRFGLEDEDRLTLEAIGSAYGITRERVRQIENFALNSIRKSPAYEKEQQVFDELAGIVSSLGGVVAEDDLLSHLAKDRGTQNHLSFFLVLGDPFTKKKEDADFRHRWIVDHDLADRVHTSLHKLHANLSPEDLVAEEEIIRQFLSYLDSVDERHRNEEAARRFLALSKRIAKNPLGEWGMADSPNIRARGMRDYAFLVIRRHGNPMHFTEVAKEIENLFGKKAHVATCHNELIKDPRFVLVGRGLYALTEWGYKNGVVRDVVAEVLKKYGPMTKEEIVDRVMKERYVKPNTILVNLQNGKHFKRGGDGTYTLA